MDEWWEPFMEPLGICGCGIPEEVVLMYGDILEHLSKEDVVHQVLLPLGDTNEVIQYALLNVLDNKGLIEHGYSIAGSWLTDKGKDLLATIQAARMV